MIYKVVGKGTEIMARMAAGDQLDTLAGLGNGYDTSKSGSHPVLIGGGVGIPPLYGLAKRLVQEGKEPLALLGFRTAEEVFLQEAFSALCPVIVTTQDGSAGRTGLVTDVLGELDYTYFYTCGPMPMFMAIEKACRAADSIRLKKRWAVASAPVWAVPARPNTEASASAKTAPCWKERKLYGRYKSYAKRPRIR